MENDGIMDKTVVQWTKLWYISGTIELRFTKEMKKMVEYQKLRNFDLSCRKKPIVIYQNN